MILHYIIGFLYRRLSKIIILKEKNTINNIFERLELTKKIYIYISKLLTFVVVHFPIV